MHYLKLLLYSTITIFMASNIAGAAPMFADIVVYGDGSGGVTAAVQGARMGKSVILVSNYHGHLGGLTSSGLGWTDIGNRAILGGLSREFYSRVYLHYQDDSAWVHEQRDLYPKKGQGAPTFDPSTKLASVFEPKVAEQIFKDMAMEAGVKIVEGRIDQANGAMLKGTMISHLRLDDGRIIGGKMFIDASYEGDLMAAAGVSFRMGRESNNEFEETHNGYTGTSHGNQIGVEVDAYLTPGDSTSGFIRGITNPSPDAYKTAIGSGDDRFQAYCYRLCLTDAPENRIPIIKPKDYEEADFEIVLRAVEVGKKQRFFKTSPMPNRKTDSNNTSGISMDYIGKNYGVDKNGKPWNWATLGHMQRDVLAKEHAYWQLGLIWTIQNHPRVPQETRRAWSRWGLCKDEFSDNNGIPYNLYVREARRMSSPFVMTEAHCRNELPVNDSIAMGAYTMDSHNVQRLVKNGSVRNEGDIQKPLRNKGPYRISYQAIVPSLDECTNLLVPWSLSSTHIAFGSIRMEPVYMCLGQAAATAASLAIDLGKPVQDIPYTSLRKRLLADDARLEMPKPKPVVVADGILLDDDLAEFSGTWGAGHSIRPFIGARYRHNAGKASPKTKATFSIPKVAWDGVAREVRIHWPAQENRATNVPITITHSEGETKYMLNQRVPGKLGGWNSLGTFTFDKQSSVVIGTKGTDGHVLVDAILLKKP